MQSKFPALCHGSACFIPIRLGCICVLLCADSACGFLLDPRFRCSSGIACRDLPVLASVPFINFEISDLHPRVPLSSSKVNRVGFFHTDAASYCRKSSLYLRGGRNMDPCDASVSRNRYLLPLQIRFMFSLGVGNLLYFLLYSVMMAYATNRAERTWCMVLSYGGKFEALKFVRLCTLTFSLQQAWPGNTLFIACWFSGNHSRFLANTSRNLELPMSHIP